jgi:UDP-glucose 4-epimerase
LAGPVNLAEGTRVVVTGGAGFFGSTLVALLLERGCKVVVLDDLSTGVLRNLPHDHPSLAIRIVRVGDPAFARLIDEEVAAAQAVFHLASPIGVFRAHAERFAVTRSIIDSSSAIAEACLRSRRPLLYTSSSEVYGAGQDQPISESQPVVTDIRPRWGYAAAKAAGEHLVAAMFHDFDVPTWIVRPFNIAGARQRVATGQVVPAFVFAALKGEPIIVHDDGNQRRSFLHVADAAEGLISIMESEALRGRPVNLGNTDSIRIGDLARLVGEVLGIPISIVKRPSQTVFGAGFAVTRNRIPDTRLLREATGWAPKRTMREAIADSVAYLESERILA